MFKIISRSFLGLALMGTALTMDTPNNPELDQSNSKASATHPAESPGCRLVDFPSDLLLHVSTFLKPSEACLYLLTCKKINNERDVILLGQVPNMYAARGHNFTDVFFPFSHSQWKPEQLDLALALKLHKCYFEASKLNVPTVEPLQLEDSTTIQRKFQLMYSVACGGHKLAAEEAGTMLLSPLYNNIIPIVVQYTDLVPEAQQWDVRRLNQPQSTNAELLQIMGKIEENFANDDSDYYTAEEEKFVSSMIQEVKKIAPTDETKTLDMFLTEVRKHMKKGLHKDLFRPIKTVEFIKGLSYRTPLIESFINMDDIEEIQSTVSVETTIPTYNGVLNADFIGDFSRTLEPLCYNEVLFFDPERPNEKSIRRENKFTPEAQKAAQVNIETKRIVVLLGGNSYYIPSMCHFFDPQNYDEYQNAQNQYHLLESKIHTFLYYLMLTRNPVAFQFKEIKQELNGILNNYGHGGGVNPSRFELLCKKFSD